jgi:hypothetical protein
MEEKRLQFLKDLQLFRDAALQLARSWGDASYGDHTGIIDAAICRTYPFHEDFDEIAGKIAGWCAATKEALAEIN